MTQPGSSGRRTSRYRGPGGPRCSPPAAEGQRPPHREEGSVVDSHPHCVEFGHQGCLCESARSPSFLLSLFAPASFVALRSAPAHAQAQAPQAGKVYRIGFLRGAAVPKAWVEAFQQGLRGAGICRRPECGRRFRVPIGSFDQLPRLAEELVRLKVDVILASAAPAALAARKATTSVPIVFVGVYDPVELGLVPSLARPGGNITGLASNSADLAGKRLELLREIVPKLRRVAVLWHAANPAQPVAAQGGGGRSAHARPAA